MVPQDSPPCYSQLRPRRCSASIRLLEPLGHQSTSTVRLDLRQEVRCLVEALHVEPRQEVERLIEQLVVDDRLAARRDDVADRQRGVESAQAGEEGVSLPAERVSVDELGIEDRVN